MVHCAQRGRPNLPLGSGLGQLQCDIQRRTVQEKMLRGAVVHSTLPEVNQGLQLHSGLLRELEFVPDLEGRLASLRRRPVRGARQPRLPRPPELAPCPRLFSPALGVQGLEPPPQLPFQLARGDQARVGGRPVRGVAAPSQRVAGAAPRPGPLSHGPGEGPREQAFQGICRSGGALRPEPLNGLRTAGTGQVRPEADAGLRERRNDF